MCGSRFYEYHIVKGGRVVSSAQVCPRLPMFKFIDNKTGIHIGPCYTIAEERGKGFYPLLLQHIMEENPCRDFYMMVHEDSIASQRGIAKVGFRKIAQGVKTKLGRYVAVP